MLTAFDKFLVAALMAGAAWTRARYQLDLGVDEASATAIVGALAACLVWLVPNRGR